MKQLRNMLTELDNIWLNSLIVNMLNIKIVISNRKSKQEKYNKINIILKQNKDKKYYQKCGCLEISDYLRGN